MTSDHIGDLQGQGRTSLPLLGDVGVDKGFIIIIIININVNYWCHPGEGSNPEHCWETAGPASWAAKHGKLAVRAAGLGIRGTRPPKGRRCGGQGLRGPPDSRRVHSELRAFREGAAQGCSPAVCPGALETHR